ncbi:MAG: hypothetical protein ACOC5E_03325 [Acidobacteriota bacterium]
MPNRLLACALLSAVLPLMPLPASAQEPDDPAAATATRSTAPEPRSIRDPDGPWRIELELGVETALDDDGFDLNVFETAELGLDLDGLAARHRWRARLDVSRRLTGELGLLLGAELLLMRGEYFRGESSRGLEPVARGLVFRYGVTLPHGLRVYMESQDHWRFAGYSEFVIDGPYEIYNMIMIGRELSWSPGRRDLWLVDGRCELGFNFPRNEFGLNLRRPEQESTDGFGDNYGRYALRCRDLGIARRIDAGPVEAVRLYANLFLALGRTIPQQLYTWSPRYIGHQRNLGLQARLRDDWTVFVERQWNWSFADDEAVPGVGPFGSYLSVGVSKRFDWRF